MNNKMVLLVAALPFFCATSALGDALTLREAIGRALESNHLLRAAALEHGAAQQELLLSHVAHGVYKNIATYVVFEKPDLWDTVISSLPRVEQDRLLSVKRWLERMHFSGHFQCIKAKAEEMSAKAEMDEGYETAAHIAHTLVNQLIQKTSDLFQADGGGFDEKQSAFQSGCLKNINDARPVLEQHRGWKRVLTALFIVLIAPVSLPLYCLGFFSTRTDSAQKLLDFEQALKSECSV